MLLMRWQRICHLLEPSEPAPAVHYTDQEGQEQMERDTYRSKTDLQWHQISGYKHIEPLSLGMRFAYRHHHWTA